MLSRNYEFYLVGHMDFRSDKALVVDSRTIIIIIIKEFVFHIEFAIIITLELSELETPRIKSGQIIFDMHIILINFL